ncbi:MAG: hypothetical protein II951_04420 [Bacteroidales bacterium]|nr:hypothetical protein [Bacteroidales bacterium]
MIDVVPSTVVGGGGSGRPRRHDIGERGEIDKIMNSQSGTRRRVVRWVA